jgi:hypothetical protein
MINSTIYASINPSLQQYVNDLELRGFGVTMYSISGGTPSSIRGLLRSLGSSGLVGCLMIGKIPAAWFKIPAHGTWDNQEFPVDLFYMDLDGSWTDSDSDGMYDDHRGNVAPEIWVGRIDFSNISGDELSLTVNYFRKVHEYREGHLLVPKRALIYVDDDWVGMEVNVNRSLSAMYDTTVVSDNLTTISSDYMQRLANGYEWVHLQCHGWSGGHMFKANNAPGGSVYSYDYRSMNPPVLFYQFFVCSGARFVERDYLAGSSIATSNYSLLAIGSAKTGSMLNFEDFYGSVAAGKCLGDSFKEWFIKHINDSWSRDWFYGMAVIGDPTLFANTRRAPAAAYFETAYSKLQSGVSWSKVNDPSSFSGLVMRASASSSNGGCLYGPYITTDWDGVSMLGKPYIASFRLKISSNAFAGVVAYIDVGYNAGPTLQSRQIRASDFASSNTWQDFQLTFITPGSLTAGLEFRVVNYNNGITDLYADYIVVSRGWGDSVVYAEGAYNKPKIAYGNPVSWSRFVDASSWSGIVLKASVSNASGSWLYGPYISSTLDGENMRGKPYVASFSLKVLSNLESSNVAYIDVSSSALGSVLQSKVIRANDFAAPNVWQDFNLTFITPDLLTSGIEFRVENLNNGVTDLYVDRIAVYRGWNASTVYVEAAYNKPKIAYGNPVSWSMLADASSGSGIVLKASVSNASGSWLYGPYLTKTWDQMNIKGKPYTAVFTLKVASRLPANDVCYLDVCCGAGSTILKSTRVKASDFTASNVWQDFKLSFIVPNPLTYGLEFRVMNLNGGITDLYIDKIELQKEWNDSTVYLEGAYNKPKIAYGNPVAWSQQIDSSSWSGIILKAPASSASGSWLYGPYITTGLDGQSLLGKSFKAVFRLKVLSNLRTDDVAYIDVSCEQGKVILDSEKVRASDFASSDGWQDFQFAFTVPSSLTYGLEFRLVNLNNNVADLSVDIITIKAT